MPTKSLMAWQARAWALVLAAVIASAAMRMIAAVGSISQVAVGASASIESAACVAVVAETLMYQDRDTLAGVELASSRQ